MGGHRGGEVFWCSAAGELSSHKHLVRTGTLSTFFFLLARAHFQVLPIYGGLLVGDYDLNLNVGDIHR